MALARTRSVLLSGLSALLFAAPAVAASSPVKLRWTAPPSCPQAADVEREIDRLLGERSAGETPLEVTGAVRRDEAGRYRVRLEIKGEDGPSSREVDASSCAALGDAAALIIAMTIDPDAVAEIPPPKKTSPPEVPGPSEPIRTSPSDVPEPPEPIRTSPPKVPEPSTPELQSRGVDVPEPPKVIRTSPPKVPEPPKVIRTSIPKVPEPSKAMRPTFGVSAHALLDIGTLPLGSLGGGAAFAVMPGRLRFQLGADFLPSRTQHFQARPKAGGDFSLLLGHAAACVSVLSSTRMDLSPCARFEAGRFHGQSFGVETPGEASAPWVAAGAQGRLATRFLTRAALVTSLDVMVPLLRPEFLVTGLESLHRPSPLVVRLALGVEVRF